MDGVALVLVLSALAPMVILGQDTCQAPEGSCRSEWCCKCRRGDTSSCGYRFLDCQEIFEKGQEGYSRFLQSGEYTIYPEDRTEPMAVYCDMDTNGGGWTVIQRRIDGSVNFNIRWNQYKRGFGDLSTEFWLGNDNIHRLTGNDDYEIRIDLKDFLNITAFAKYSHFMVANETQNYNLRVFGYAGGNAGDSLSAHDDCEFSTRDDNRDNDKHPGHCAQTYRSGFWFGGCHQVNTNGLFLNGPNAVYARGVIWNSWRGYHYSLCFSEMKIRRRQIIPPSP